MTGAAPRVGVPSRITCPPRRSGLVSCARPCVLSMHYVLRVCVCVRVRAVGCASRCLLNQQTRLIVKTRKRHAPRCITHTANTCSNGHTRSTQHRHGSCMGNTVPWCDQGRSCADGRARLVVRKWYRSTRRSPGTRAIASTIAREHGIVLYYVHFLCTQRTSARSSQARHEARDFAKLFSSNGH